MKTIRKPFAGLLCLLLLLSMLTACASGGVQDGSLPSEPSGTSGETSSDDLPSETQIYPEEYYDFSRKETASGEVLEDWRNIPEDILEILTTKQLFLTCLHYPRNHPPVYASTILPYSDSFVQRLYYYGDYNCLYELMQRENLSAVLVDYYTSLTAEDITDQNGVSKEADVYTEFLVKQCEVSKDACEKIYEKLGTLREVYASAASAGDSQILIAYGDLRGTLEARMLMSDEALQDALKEQKEKFLTNTATSIRPFR